MQPSINKEEFDAFCNQDEILKLQKEALLANPFNDPICYFLNEIKGINLNERNQFVSGNSFYVWPMENIRVWVTQNAIPSVYWDDERQEYVANLNKNKEPQTVGIKKKS